MSKTTDDGKICALLSYVFVGIIWFFVDVKMRKNTFAKFHVKQSIIFIVLLILTNLAVALFSLISKAFGNIIGIIMYALLGILWILGVVFAAAGREKELPVVGAFTKFLDF